MIPVPRHCAFVYLVRAATECRVPHNVYEVDHTSGAVRWLDEHSVKMLVACRAGESKAVLEDIFAMMTGSGTFCTPINDDVTFKKLAYRLLEGRDRVLYVKVLGKKHLSPADVWRDDGDHDAAEELVDALHEMLRCDNLTAKVTGELSSKADALRKELENISADLGRYDTSSVEDKFDKFCAAHNVAAEGS